MIATIKRLGTQYPPDYDFLVVGAQFKVIKYSDRHVRFKVSKGHMMSCNIVDSGFIGGNGSLIEISDGPLHTDAYDRAMGVL